MPKYTVMPAGNPHDPTEMKYHVMTEPEHVAVYDTEEEAQAHAAVGEVPKKAKRKAKVVVYKHKAVRKHK